MFPTPVSDIMAVAKVEEVQEDVLSPSLVEKIRAELGKTGDTLKRALGKVIGLFDARASLVFIDRSLMTVKQTFVRLHEAAHGFLSWQRPMYQVVEDCEQALEPGVADAFDRQANVFAAEVLFQLDAFALEAADKKFSVFTPVNMAKKYGASVYASVRQYVAKHHKNCAVLVLNPPALVEGNGFTAELRRTIQSESFTEMFGAMAWPETFTPDDQIGAIVPIGRKASKPQPIVLKDRNGDEHECLAEAFNNSWYVFVLIHEVKALTATSALVIKH